MKFLSGTRKIRFNDDSEDSPEPHTYASHLDTIKDPVELTGGVLNARGRRQEKKYRFLRLSEIDGACPREWTLGHTGDVSKFESVAFASVVAMDMGSALHSWIQNSTVYFGSNLLGFWRCRACSNRRRFGVKPTEPCEFCGANVGATTYSEYMFRLTSPYRVVGKVDLILKVGDVYRLGEIKTIGKDFERAQGAHVAQLASYIYFSQFDDSLPITIDRSVGYLIYFSKKFNYRAPVKTFPVKPTDRYMAPLIEKAKQFTEGVDKGKIPPVWDECISSFWRSSRAKKCPVVDECRRLHEIGQEVL